MAVKNKRVLKQIAKDISSKCISSIDSFAFEGCIEDGLIDEEEVEFVIEECKVIASKISNKNIHSTEGILRHYFNYSK